MGEPTIKVSTTPRSLAHAQPIVNDVVKTQTQTKIFHCDSCDVFCYDVEAFKRHKGNKSLQNSQRLPVAIKQKTPPLFANDIAVNSLFVCDIPDLATFQNQNIVTKHLEGKKVNSIELLVFAYKSYLLIVRFILPITRFSFNMISTIEKFTCKLQLNVFFITIVMFSL